MRSAHCSAGLRIAAAKEIGELICHPPAAGLAARHDPKGFARMRTVTLRTPLSALLALTLAAALALVAPAAALDLRASVSGATAELDPALVDQLAAATAGAEVTVFVHATDVEAAKAAVLGADLAPITTWDRIGVAVGAGTPAQVTAVAAQPGVTYVEADQQLGFTMMTSHEATRGYEALETFADADGNPFDGSGVSIAVIDSGIDGTHPMFTMEDGSSKVRRNMKNVCGVVLSAQFRDDCFADVVFDSDTISVGGHGTHVAGTAAGNAVVTSDGRELSGAAPGAELISLSVGAAVGLLDANSAMAWVLDHHENPCALNIVGPTECAPIRVTNHSYGPVGDNPGKYDSRSATARLQDELVAEGIAVVWAAGNSGGDGTTSTTNPPAQSPTPGIFSVASFFDFDLGFRDGIVSSFSSRGEEADPTTYPDISAPGQNITSACRPYLAICLGGSRADLNYGTISGTSMAAPHIAGIVAVLLSADPTLTPGEVEQAIKSTAYQFEDGAPYDTVDPHTTGPDGAPIMTSFDKGAGLVDVVEALRAIGATELSYGGARRARAACASVLARRAELRARELGVQALGTHELSVGAALHDPARLHDEDEVGLDDGRQPVGDHEGGPALQAHRQGALDRGLRLAVEVAGRLVEEHDRRVLQQHPGDGQPLLLTAGHPVAPLPHERVVAIGQGSDDMVDLRRCAGLLQLRIGGSGLRVTEVLPHRGVEQVRILGHDADDAGERRQRDVAHVDAVDAHRTRRDVVQARDEVEHRGLACP
jgi:subtilisin family serine protease